MAGLRLSEAQRGFFGWVAEAVFANPFGPERAALDRRIAGIDPRAPADPARTLELAIEQVERRVRELDPDGRLRPDRYPAEDARLLQWVGLFRIYHAFRDEFGQFIERQAQSAEPLAPPFADALWAELAGLGLDAEARARYLGVFYQVRRGFHCIEREIVGLCPAVVELRMRLWNAIFTFRPDWYLRCLVGRMEDFSTLLLGETGTGKTAAARAIGYSGFIPYDPKTRRFKESYTRAFVGINLAQFPPGVIESELFGHRKGAFSGAIDHHQGVLARCSAHGAVLMDEIGDVEPLIQLKLLTVLQERRFTPVGGREPQQFNGRVIAATHRDLGRLRAEGRFRDDFFYRLCSDVIALPPLRQRIAENPAELRLMVAAILVRTFGPDGLALVDGVEERTRASVPADYPWPGNVRELEQCVRRICLTGRYEADGRAAPDGFLRRVAEGGLTADELLAGYLARLYGRCRTYEEVARRSGLDRRTVKRYIGMGEPEA
ncbi:sigma-54-dependent transcriptional regulator [Methylomagnum ishizawai]|uniref:sigma-54-dependent transcriptional regulator n=1 Tax=Methylomagnum ishizawai TaxID=1760988 RepID=UPI001C32E290|nr:sigma 54-interacting transcriptional regulator [Methylomagnum ishizawai]BBL76467.1 Fis family transcriptional regulator [Methylomagnum ishizawai]